MNRDAELGRHIIRCVIDSIVNRSWPDLELRLLSFSPEQLRWRPVGSSTALSIEDVLNSISTEIEAAILACANASDEELKLTSSLGQLQQGCGVREFVWALGTRIDLLKKLLEALDASALTQLDRQSGTPLMRVIMEIGTQLAMHVGELQQLASIIPRGDGDQGPKGLPQ